MKNSKSVNELLSTVNKILRDSGKSLLPGESHLALCTLADAVSQQQEVIDSLREQVNANNSGRTRYGAVALTPAIRLADKQKREWHALMDGLKEDREPDTRPTYTARYYQNGAHIGSIYYGIYSFGGINSLATEAKVKARLDELISVLQID